MDGIEGARTWAGYGILAHNLVTAFNTKTDQLAAGDVDGTIYIRSFANRSLNSWDTCTNRPRVTIGH